MTKEEIVEQRAAYDKERAEWLANLKTGDEAICRTSGQGYYDRKVTVLSIANGIIETDGKSNPAFSLETGDAIEERQKFSFPAWLEVPGGLGHGGEYE